MSDHYTPPTPIVDGDPANASDINDISEAVEAAFDTLEAEVDGIGTPNLTKSVTVESPTDSEDITLFYTDVAITITQITSVVKGATPSVTVQIKHDTDRSSAGTQINSATITSQSGTEDTSFDDATVPANSWVWLETSAKSGTVTFLHVSIEYSED
jgi:hypothetical protein